uniref:HMG box domain-containing protein n=3 Tax=Kalmanozyma brasiliensis (strain GHG001) TaxID=1365824 RepID=V5E5I4_KALBG
MVDLFEGWSTDPQPSDRSSNSSNSLPTLQDELNSVHIKRSASQQDAVWSSIDVAPTFDSISFPRKDTSFAVSLYTGQSDDANLEQKPLPPSKRPGVSHARKTPPNHIKRPRNAYILFRSHTVSQKLIPKEVEHDHRNISRIIAHMWKSLAPEDRAYYEKMAKDEKERHKQLFPDYRYQPTTRRTEVSKRNVKKLENGEEECQEIADIILKAQGKDGVVVRSGPSKGVKRAREATRRESAAPRIKRTKASKPKTVKTGAGEASSAPEQMLETVFLQPSLSHSPSSTFASGSTTGPAPALSPEPFQLASNSPAVEDAPGIPLADPLPTIADIFGRRASSLPALRPPSPPPSFIPATHESTAEVHATDLTTDVPQDQSGCMDNLIMPAPAWKGRKTQPSPIPNTWQYASYDDQALPSPRSFNNSFAAAGRSRTAMPSTPSSGTFRGFFHPWAFEHGDSMLISPVHASFQDGRRRSSFARSGSVSRRPGSFAMEAPLGDRAETNLSTSDAQLFDEAARAAAISLESQAVADDYDAHAFAFDPALESESCEPMRSHYPPHPPPPALDSPRQADSPRTSFSGSTLAAAARDWTSIRRRRSRLSTHEIPPPSDNAPVTCGDPTPVQGGPKYSSLQESVERAVSLALGKDGAAAGADRGQIVQQILSSLNAELALPQQNDPLPNRPRERRSNSFRSSQYYPASTGAECRHSKPLPSPLQLVMSNHEMNGETYSHY